ncbi:hypothetical protein GBF38_004943, partial [Nibea albiflora]
MSRGDALRGFVTDRLAAASREILAVVDRVVAGYEEEASGFRREIDRQRRQLEVLLQPRVTLTRTGVKRGRSLGLDEEGEEDEDGDEDEDEDGTPEPSENLEESTNQTPPRGQGKKKKKKPGRPHISEPQNQVDLRIRFLEDVQTDVVSNSNREAFEFSQDDDPRWFLFFQTHKQPPDSEDETPQTKDNNAALSASVMKDIKPG